jgi:hypothetical protein
VKELMEFIQDDDRLREERKKAKKAKDKYVGMSSDIQGGGSRYSEYFVDSDYCKWMTTITQNFHNLAWT